MKICIVISSYNNDVTDGLFKSAKEELENSKVTNFEVIKVPGAFEIPFAISKMINKFDGFIAIGCIIKGETANFDLICNGITNGIIQLSINEKKPIGNSILTTFNKGQALKIFDRGKEAAKAVLEVLKIN